MKRKERRDGRKKEGRERERREGGRKGVGRREKKEDERREGGRERKEKSKQQTSLFVYICFCPKCELKKKKNRHFVIYLPIILSDYMFQPVTFKKFVPQKCGLSLEIFALAPQNCLLDFFRKLCKRLNFLESLHKTFDTMSFFYCFPRRLFGCL